LKTENVLVNKEYHTKLIDMGVCAQFGAQDALRAPYMAPELCEGGVGQREEVDCWGTGLILHQVYQHRWQLLSCQRSEPTKMMPGTPSTKHAMDEKVKQAMFGLLKFKKKDRWTMDILSKSDWLQTVPTVNSREWLNPTRNASESGRVSLQVYKSSQPMPTALAVNISNKNHSHLMEVPLGDLNLGKDLGVTVLLIKQSNGNFERVPGADTKISKGDWMYFGVPQGEGFTEAVAGLEAKLKPNQAKVPITRSQSSGRFRPLSKKEVVESGYLVEFAVEFDCFKFPEHIGQEAEIGPNGLDLRKKFAINLVGIESLQIDQDGKEVRSIEWFPKGNSKVSPGNLGLVMREPCADGSSRPTMTDKDLMGLMHKELFQKQATR